MENIITKNKEIKVCEDECKLLENEIKNKRILLRQKKQEMMINQERLQELIEQENDEEPAEEEQPAE